MKILLGIDTSPQASETVSCVCRMTWPTGTSVRVLSVLASNEPEMSPTPVLLASVAQDLAVIRDMQAETHEEIVARVEQRLREAGLSVTTEIVGGDPGHALVAAARAHEADLVVVGSHEHRSVGHVVMGGVAPFLAAHAPCDVLVVRHKGHKGHRTDQDRGISSMSPAGNP